MKSRVQCPMSNVFPRSEPAYRGDKGHFAHRTLDVGHATLDCLRGFQYLPVQSYPPDQNQTLLSKNKARRPERA